MWCKSRSSDEVGLAVCLIVSSRRSLHNEGQAIDMSISWTGTVSVKDGNGKLIEMKSLRRSGMNSQLKAIGASYGVKKFVGGAKDKPHWSINGR
nr:hypothetical protein [uncultured Duganella sp.]